MRLPSANPPTHCDVNSYAQDRQSDEHGYTRRPAIENALADHLQGRSNRPNGSEDGAVDLECRERSFLRISASALPLRNVRRERLIQLFPQWLRSQSPVGQSQDALWHVTRRGEVAPAKNIAEYKPAGIEVIYLLAQRVITQLTELHGEALEVVMLCDR